MRMQCGFDLRLIVRNRLIVLVQTRLGVMRATDLHCTVCVLVDSSLALSAVNIDGAPSPNKMLSALRIVDV